MTNTYFSVGSIITWTQYKSKEDAKGTVRKGIVWSEAPAFEKEAGAFVWVIPTTALSGECSAIAVKVHRSGAKRGTAVVYENAASYKDYSCKERS